MFFFMNFREKQKRILHTNIRKLNHLLSQSQVSDLMEVVGNSKKLLFRNLLSGLTKGIGIGIGVTIITAIILILLERLVTLNIPVIGEYISDIVKIVEQAR